MLMCLITGALDLDHLVKVLLARFLYGKVTVFPFVIKKITCGDILRLCKYPVFNPFLFTR